MNSLFEKIDGYFATKQENETKAYFAIVAVVIIAIMYFLIWDGAQYYYDQKLGNLNKVTKSLHETNAYLTKPEISGPDGKNREYGINLANQRLAKAKSILADYENGNIYFDQKLLEVSSVTYNEKNWAKFLDSLTTSAQKYGVEIISITSKVLDPKLGEISPMLSATVKLQSSFKPFLKYINSIEESEMVVDVSAMDLNSTNGKIKGDITMKLWGIKYGNNVGTMQ